jgi:hypothetical protein
LLRYTALLFCAAAICPASTAVLYNGSLASSPGSQGWSFASLGIGTYGETQSGGANVMTTTSIIRAGYGLSSPLPLDAASGYRFTLDLKVDSEAHSSANRSGFSLILIDSDLKGIELGFWTDHVWAQNAGFTHGEDAGYDATQRTLYTLTVLGSGYTLSAGNTSLFSGSLRDYTASGLPYTVPNFVFAGDDTFEADSSVRFFNATLTQLPEPGTWALGAIGLLAYACKKRLNS